MSTRPNRSIVSAYNRSRAASSVMSASNDIERSPESRVLRYSSERFQLLSELTTDAPDWSSPSTTVRPMPRALPVTTATRPARAGPNRSIAASTCARCVLRCSSATSLTQSLLVLARCRQIVLRPEEADRPRSEEDRDAPGKDRRVEMDRPPADAPVPVDSADPVVTAPDPPRLVPQLAGLADHEAALHLHFAVDLVFDEDVADHVAGHRHRRLDVGEPGVVLGDASHESRLVVPDDRVPCRGHLPLDVLRQGHEVLDVVGQEIEPLLEAPLVQEMGLPGEQLLDRHPVFDAQHQRSSSVCACADSSMSSSHAR